MSQKMIISEPPLPALKMPLPGMAKVDRLGWVAGFSLRAFGVDIGIRSNDPETLHRVAEHLPPYWERINTPAVDRVYSILHRNGSGEGSRRQSTVYTNADRLMRSDNLNELFEAFESNVRMFVAEFAKDRVFVHAGVVGWSGQAIVVPGRSFSGKSTLVAALVRAGATYYSDEYAVIDASGRVHPYFKPIELRAEGTNKQSKFDVSSLGGHEGTESLPVGLVLITKYKPDATWRPRKLTSGKAVLELLNNTVSARRDPEAALNALRHVVASADVVKGVRGEAEQTAPLILRKLDRRTF
ncbi:MAG TPA: hypothetical protein VJV03_10470 [Pyrinomonadaceae bacterium]|nr:hypothetical protein [Pyrinomonadaceae bacterium]